jgi:hypothetical protein
MRDLDRAHRPEQADVLERPRYAHRHDLVRPATGDVAPLERDRARRRRVQAREDVEERRLARPVRPDDRDDRATRDRERDVVDGRQAAELLRDADGLEDVRRLAVRARGAHPILAS